MYTYANIAVPAKICILSCNSLSNYLVIYNGSGNNQQLFIVSRQFFKGVLTEIAGMGIFTVNEQHRAADFVTVSQYRRID